MQTVTSGLRQEPTRFALPRAMQHRWIPGHSIRRRVVRGICGLQHANSFEGFLPCAMENRIDTIGLSTRTLNALAAANIRTVGGIARKKVIGNRINVGGITASLHHVCMLW